MAPIYWSKVTQIGLTKVPTGYPFSERHENREEEEKSKRVVVQNTS